MRKLYLVFDRIIFSGCKLLLFNTGITRSISSLLNRSYHALLISTIALIFCANSANAATISSTAGGGNWSSPATWVGGVVPVATDNVIISAGSTVLANMDYSTAAGNRTLTINGTLNLPNSNSTDVSLLNYTSVVINCPGKMFWQANDNITFSTGTSFDINGYTVGSNCGIQPESGNAAKRLTFGVGANAVAVSNDNSNNAPFSFAEFNKAGGLPLFRLTSSPASPATICYGSAYTDTIVPYDNNQVFFDCVWSVLPANGTTITPASASNFKTAQIANIIPVSLTTPVTYTITCKLYESADNGHDLFTTKTVTVTINPAGVWSGGNTNWNDASNWCGGVPTASTDVIIPSSLTYYPVVPASGGPFFTKNITIQSGASVTVDPSASLTIKGVYSNLGTLTNNGRIVLNGTVAQSFPGSSATIAAMNELEVNNAAGVSINKDFSITGMLVPTAGAIALGSSAITLKSSATVTATVSALGATSSFTYGTGGFIVERYISGKRAWRFLSVPTNTAQTFHEAWQENMPRGSTTQTTPSGYGTQITNNTITYATDGFDYYSPDGPSVKKWNQGSNSYVSILNTAVGIKTTEGLMTFVRGDRTAVGLYATPTTAVLRTKGPLFTGDQAPITLNMGKYTSIGNPYAAPLDMRLISKTGGADSTFVLMDPLLNALGTFQYFTKLGNDYYPSPGFGSYLSPATPYNYIASGSAFFFSATSANGSITIKESAKASGDLALVFRPMRQTANVLRTSLYLYGADGNMSPVDGVLNIFGDNNSNGIDGGDAKKLENLSENLSIIVQDQLLAIERRHTLKDQDTIFLNMAKPKAKPYRFEFAGENFDPALTAFLEDSYNNTRTPIDVNGTTTYDFDVINDSASWNPTRFRIVFKASANGPLPITLSTIKAYLLNSDISVDWTVSDEKNIKYYEVERSADGQQFTLTATVNARDNNGHSVNYQWLDGKPRAGINYYRIKTVGINGEIQYSTVVKVTIGKGSPEIKIYPNPVAGGKINLHFINLPTGNYEARIMNALGQVMLREQIKHVETTNNETIKLNKNIVSGTYRLEVNLPDNSEMSTNLRIQ